MHRLCVFVCLYTCFYGKISKGLRGQPPSITNSEGNGERDGGREAGRWRKQHLEKRRRGDRRKVNEWMERSRLALIELGSVVYILYR